LAIVLGRSLRSVNIHNASRPFTKPDPLITQTDLDREFARRIAQATRVFRISHRLHGASRLDFALRRLPVSPRGELPHDAPDAIESTGPETNGFA